jgi:hypothetical protein
MRSVPLGTKRLGNLLEAYRNARRLPTAIRSVSALLVIEAATDCQSRLRRLEDTAMT